VRPRERADPAAVLTACIVAVAFVAGFVALVITLKGGIAAIALLLVLVPAWFSWRRRRAARRRR
jgi:Flp pilus assembly protein TadB